MAVCCCIPDPRKDWGKAFGCFPLSAAGIILSLILAAMGGWEVQRAVSSSDWADWSTVILLVLAILKLISGVCGLVGIVLRAPFLAAFFLCGLKMVLFSMIAGFIMQWIVWIFDLVDGWKPTDGEIVDMVVYTILYAFLFILTWWMFSVFSSLQAVLTAGGSGWEKQNFKEIRIAKAMRDEDHKSDSSRSSSTSDSEVGDKV